MDVADPKPMRIRTLMVCVVTLAFSAIPGPSSAIRRTAGRAGPTTSLRPHLVVEGDGIVWTQPFTAAKEVARRTGRPLFIYALHGEPQAFV
jgi:hypothetical protein